MKKELIPEDLIKKYESDGWIKECNVGDHTILVKDLNRIGVNIKTGDITPLTDNKIERYQTMPQRDFIKRINGPYFGIKYRDDEKL